MSETIPGDIREAAEAAFDNMRADESLFDAVCRAILAERERCAKIARAVEATLDDTAIATKNRIVAAIRP